MASQAAIKRIQVWIWVLIYGGLLTFILGHFVSRTDVDTARVMGMAGMVAVAVGVVLIFVRAKMKAPPAPDRAGDKP
jgi:hypothetical protein